MTRILLSLFALLWASCTRDNSVHQVQPKPELDKPYVAWFHDSAYTARILPALDSDLPLSQNFDYACTDLPCPRFGIQYHTNGTPADSFTVDPSGAPSINLAAYYSGLVPSECRRGANRYTNIGLCLQTGLNDTLRVFNSQVDTYLVGSGCLGRLPWGDEIGVWVIHGRDSLFLSVAQINSHDDYFIISTLSKQAF